jgi:hypothetical protein
MGYVSGLRCNPRGYPQAVFAKPIIFLSLISREHFRNIFLNLPETISLRFIATC